MPTLGQRLNNPLNVRFSPMNNWKGQTGEERGFCKFVHVDYGYRAALILLRNYVRKGYNDLKLIVSRWAPPSENDTLAYIRFLKSHGVSDVIRDISDIILLCKYMAAYESDTSVDTDYLVDIAVGFDITL